MLDTPGFILIDGLYRPIYANPESVKILGYPNAAEGSLSLDSIITQKIMTFLPRDLDLSSGLTITQFQSGKRHYSCRVFLLENHSKDVTAETRIALLLERGLPGPPGNEKKNRKMAGMTEDPFSFAPDARYYYFSRGHAEVFSCLRSMIRDRRGMGVLLGQAGMGKTALLDYLSKTLRHESVIALFPGSFENRSEVLLALMGVFGIETQGADPDKNLRRLENWLEQKFKEERLVTLICDDAQDLSIETLETLCKLSEMRLGQKQLIQVVLSGRQGLLEKLSGSRLEHLGSQANAFSRLIPLDEAEVRSYVLHRLRIAGCTRQLFSSAALSSIALYSRGIPLNINMICRHSLSLAATINLQVIDERIVADSAYDLVLRAQPANMWDDPMGGQPEATHSGGALRDRRGLHLVQKNNT